MKKLKKFLRYILISSLVSPTIIFLFVKFFVEGRLQAYIENKGSESLSGQVSMDKLHISFWPPISLIADNLHITKTLPEVDATVPKVSLSMDMKEILKAQVIFRLTANNPNIAVVVPEIPPHPPLPDATRTKIVFGSVKQRLAVGLNVVLEKAAISVTKSGKLYSLSELDVDFLAPGFGVPWNLKLATELNLETPFKMAIPAKLSSQFQFDGDTFESKDVALEFAGIATQFKGKSILSSEEHQWDGQIDIADLKNFPVPTDLTSEVKSWSGALKVGAHLEHTTGTPWRAKGNVSLQSVAFETNIEKPEARIQGQVLTDAVLDFNYQDHWVINKLNANVDLGDCLVSSAQFSKPRGLEFKGSLVADGNQDFFNLIQGRLTLNNLSLQAHGRIDNRPSGLSDLNVTIPSTSVEGLERFFPALASTPLKGRVELSGNLNGNLHDPKSLSINVNPLTFEKIKGAVVWTSADGSKSLKGIVSADGKLIFVAQGQKISQGSLTLHSDLTGLAISLKGQLEKNENRPLKINLRASQKGQTILISEGQFLTPAGELNLTGNIQDPSAPKVNFALNFPKFDLGALSKLSPLIEVWKLSGWTQGKLFLSGLYDLKEGLVNSPLNLSGIATFTIPHFSYVKKTKNSQTPSMAKGILPDWPIMRALNLSTQVSIGALDYDNLNIQGVSAKALVKNSILTGRLDIKKIFQGAATFDKIETNLLVPSSSVSGNLTLAAVNLTDVLAWGAPQWKDTAKGLVSGQLTLHSGPETSVMGHLEVKKGFLSTVSFDKYLNDKLAHIPGVGANKSVNTKGTAMDVTSSFDFVNNQFFIKRLDAMTPEKNELQVAGVIKSDKTLDLKGKAMLSVSSLGGEIVSCNADKTGRMVLPLHVSGTMANPEYNLADGTIQGIIAQTASCQALKLKDEAKKALSKLLN